MRPGGWPPIYEECITMDKIKFLMTDTGAQTTALCRQALEDDAYILVISDGTRTSDMVVCE